MVGNTGGFHLLDITRRILGTGQFFFENVQAEARVDALPQDPAQLGLALKNQHILAAACACRQRGGHAGRATTNHQHIANRGQRRHLLCSFTPSRRAVRMVEAPPSFVTARGDSPSSSLNIASTRGMQKPP